MISFFPICRRVLYIATIEKASGLINSLIENKRIGELGLVVTDEVHMIGEPSGRGALLEGMLTKLRYAARKLSSWSSVCFIEFFVVMTIQPTHICMVVIFDGIKSLST